jgi:hypothetical protein
MNDELYDLWKQRAAAEPSPDFADRIMDAVRRESLPSASTHILPLSSPVLRVAACVLAAVACLYRMAAVVAVFFVQ